MNFNIDSAIFIGFLVANLLLGLYSSRGIKTIKEYAIGDRNFSTATISATIVATWISGGIFFTIISESYSNGLYFMWAGSGDAICLLVVGYFFAPRLTEFLGKLSIAEAMGDLYGKHVRIATSVAGFIGVSGVIAMQFKIAGLTFEYIGVPGIYGVLVGGLIVTLYSTLGGIKSVTFTDVIQFFTFGTIIPTIAFVLLNTLDSIDVIKNTLSTNKLFDYKKVFDFTEPKAFYYLFLFLFFAIPAFNSAIFQRIAMAKNTRQIRRSFIIAGFTCLFLMVTIDWIGILVLSIHPNLAPNEVVKHIIFDYSFTGLKGLTLAGIMAMLMSTADSYINSSAVLVVHDFCKPLGINIVKSELTFSRLASLLIGIFAIILSLRSGSLLQLALTTYSFYMPIVTVPFIMTVVGFRSSGKAVLIGMVAGLVTVILWDVVLKINSIDGLVPGMVANLFFLLGSHYLLKQPGGWIGIKDDAPLRELRQERQIRIKRLVNSVINFDPVIFFRNNSLKSEGMYAFFGLFCIISIYSTMHTIPKELKLQYPTIISVIHTSVLFMATVLISYPLWLNSWKESIAGPVFWNIAVFYILIFAGFLLVIMSNFAQLQLIAFMVNLIVIAALVKWQWALFLMITGLASTIQFFKLYVGIDHLPISWGSLEFETTYILLLVSSIMIIFLKPKQEQQELTDQKVDHLSGRIGSQEKQLREALGLRGEFIRNISHEYHAPMTGITSTAQTLWERYDKLNDAQICSGLENIFKSSLRLEYFDANIASLSKLSKAGYELKLEPVDLSELLYDRVENCRKLYEENKEDREFILNIEEGITINGDKYYLTQVLDNLIINSITYCKKGKIALSLKQEKNIVHFTITDEGIGILTNELEDIFAEFIVSSKTHTSAGGRGVGLALCKRVIEVHGGTISAESDGIKGATFKVSLLR